MKPTVPRQTCLALLLVFLPPLPAEIHMTGSAKMLVTDSASVTFPNSTLQVADSAQVRVESGSTLTGATIEIAPLAKLQNCGTVKAAIVNHGEVVADCGGTSTFLGTVTNHGVFRVSHGTTPVLTGAFRNEKDSLLDLITATNGAAPAPFSNDGRLVEAKDVRATEIVAGPVDVTIMIEGIPPHTYQLHGRDRLSPGLWAPIGPVQFATGGFLQFDHPDAAEDSVRFFYKVLVGDP